MHPVPLMQVSLTTASPPRSPAFNLATSPSVPVNTHLADATLAAVDSSTLLRGKKAVAIRHNGSVYRLQATKLGKLILTK